MRAAAFYSTECSIYRMGSFYITTGRKPSDPTRKLARWLAAILGGETENRGHRGLGELVERAKAKGLRRVLFIYESHGNPARLVLWEDEWLEPEVWIKSVRFHSAAGGRLAPGFRVVAEDDFGKRVKGLLELEEPEGEVVELHASVKCLRFEFCGCKVGPELVLRQFGV